ncbi:hypothetical protein E2C01_093251 [Portunus trituberculatus]|uniref:Uncharacterized protein n=1 Tax=Portunus trituberculatus TaxID=210409 RepID=A0A5B7JY32_PORTR|nr:hypothetical protein [Portunus trituberculatus]
MSSPTAFGPRGNMPSVRLSVNILHQLILWDQYCWKEGNTAATCCLEGPRSRPSPPPPPPPPLGIFHVQEIELNTICQIPKFKLAWITQPRPARRPKMP